MSRSISFLAAVLISGCQQEPERAANVTESENAQRLSGSTCPDSETIDLEHCEFESVQTALRAKGNAVERFTTAMAVCGQHDQTTINFCLRFLYPLAEEELTASYAMAKPSPSVAAFVGWKRRVESSCTPDYPRDEGGSGYSSRISRCEIRAYAEKIDQLSQISGPGT